MRGSPNGSEPDGKPHAANELTLTGWDPVSKQPFFKAGAVNLAPARDGED